MSRQSGRTKTIASFMKGNKREITPCPVCGLSQEIDSSIRLILHHRDLDRSNNKSENLEFPCTDCHMTRHLKSLENGEYEYVASMLTDSALLAKIDAREIEVIWWYGSTKYRTVIGQKKIEQI